MKVILNNIFKIQKRRIHKIVIQWKWNIQKLRLKNYYY